MPAVPSCILDPIRDQFLALLPTREERHFWGCHNPRIADAVVFDRLVQVLVFGCGYERVADGHCSARDESSASDPESPFPTSAQPADRTRLAPR